MFYSDNPVRDAERYDACQRDPAVIGKCAACGDTIYDDDMYYDIEGDLIHENHLDKWASKYLING